LENLKTVLGEAEECQKNAVSAIMTTDTVIKKTSQTINLDGNKITIWACVKGSGMIAPDLRGFHATMLAFILTDANISNANLQKLLENSVKQSFNCVTVDGDTSTNDTVIILANGCSCPKPLSAKALKKFGEQLDKITLELAKNLVADGEGATKLIEIEIRRAKSKADAKKVAQTIANSPLFKTAMFGADANWGRVLAAMGRSGVNFDPNKVDIYMAGLNVFKKGKPLKIDEKKAKILLSAKNIKVAADLNNGKESATYYTCDLSYDYVKINGDYRS
jgi:glutamate N-acetyltransferase/amino-acid N-acetyltransferase